jgi:hypothetical protein
MKWRYYLLMGTVILLLNGCSILEKTSRHGFLSGFYHIETDPGVMKKVYLDISEDSITVYPVIKKAVADTPVFGISLLPADTFRSYPEKFCKKSLDIDITTILFKFRPGRKGLPAQLTTDFNAAMYVGWRHDNYHLKSISNPGKEVHYETIGRGFDLGFIAGPGTTLVGPFSTKEVVINEYNGMIIQYGIAGFIESSVASFGISAGFDHLLSPDRKVWIYNKQPWIGFVVGIALN